MLNLHRFRIRGNQAQCGPARKTATLRRHNRWLVFTFTAISLAGRGILSHQCADHAIVWGFGNTRWQRWPVAGSTAKLKIKLAIPLAVINCSQLVRPRARGPRVGPELRELAIIDDGALAVRGERMK